MTIKVSWFSKLLYTILHYYISNTFLFVQACQSICKGLKRVNVDIHLNVALPLNKSLCIRNNINNKVRKSMKYTQTRTFKCNKKFNYIL